MTDKEYSRLQSRVRYAENPERVKAYNRKYYQVHRAEIAERRKAKRLSRREQCIP